MLPPSVPRFWLAIEPVQLAASARMENSFAMTRCLRISVKVVPAPIMMASGVTSMKRSSSRFQSETSFFLLETTGAEGDH
jgi:hypothetical protein